MTLYENEITTERFARRTPKMVEADLVKRRRGRIARDVTTVLRALAIRVNDHRHGVPANISLESTLDRTVARVFRLLADGNRIQIRRVRAIRQVRARAARMVDHALEQIMRAVGAVNAQHRVHRL